MSFRLISILILYLAGKAVCTGFRVVFASSRCTRAAYSANGRVRTRMPAQSLASWMGRWAGCLLKSNFGGFERQSLAFVESGGGVRVRSCAWLVACVVRVE